MAGPKDAPSWEAVDHALEFDLPHPLHIPRGWERAPKSPHRAHQKGRKVWKRTEPRMLAGQDYPAADKNGDERPALADISNNTPRPVKKLRLKDQDAAREAQGTRASRYLATLRDITQSTPRRKQTTTTGLDSPRVQLLEQANSEFKSFGNGNANNQVIEDLLRASSSPAPVAAQAMLRSPSSVAEEDAPLDDQGLKVHEETPESEGTPLMEDVQEEARAADAEAGTTPRVTADGALAREPESPPFAHEVIISDKGVPISRYQMAADDSEPNADIVETNDHLGQETQHIPEKEAQDTEEREKDSSNSQDSLNVSTSQDVSKIDSPREGKDVQHAIGTPCSNVLTPRAQQIRDPIGPDSPQIGTTLLRRESLRRNTSPRKGPGRPKGSSPKKQLKKRDTLQEREILQRFEDSDAETKKDVEQSGDSATPFIPKVFFLPDSHPEASSEADVKSIEEGIHDEQVINSVDDAILESQDLQRAVEAIEASEEAQSGTGATDNAHSVLDGSADQQAYDAIAHAEVDEAQAAIKAACEKADLPVRKTRSGARFSDDASMLKDFLDRAQARKAAQGGGLSPKVPKSLQQSPRRSPQKINAIRPASRSSPRKAKVLAPKPTKFQKGSPSGKITLRIAKSNDANDDEDEDDETNGEETKSADPGACRRSTRTRLPTPAKNPQGAPSFIPVRRTDGTDTVVLQKTQAQELAITTRANTRRNKGQSRPPALALQDIVSDDAESTRSSTQRAANGKAVVWAEQLTSFQEWQEGIEESEEQLPKVKRMRGLGNSNGTPVGKRMAAFTSSSNGTPAPKRRSKMR